MLHLILGILKIIGIILLIVLCLLFLGIAALLFVPVRYQLAGKKTEGCLEGHICVSWLLRMIRVTADYSRENWTIKLKLFGMTLKRFEKENEAVREEKQERKTTKKTTKKIAKKTSKTNSPKKEKEKKPKNEADKPLEGTENLKIKEQKPTAGKATKRSISEKILDFFDKLTGLLSSAQEFPERVEKKKEEMLRKISPYMQENSRALYRRLLAHLRKLWKHYCPRKVWGWVRYGTGAPDKTGELTGILYLLLPASAENVQLLPDFEETVFETDAGLRGHIRAFWTVEAALVLWRDRELRKMIRRVRGGK